MPTNEFIDDRKKMLDEINVKRAASGQEPLSRLPRGTLKKKTDELASESVAAEVSLDPQIVSETRRSIFDSLEGIFKIRYSKLDPARSVALDKTLAMAVNYELQNSQISPRKALWGTVIANFCILTLDAVRARRAERQEEKNQSENGKPKDSEPLPAAEIYRRSGGPGKYSEIPAFVGPVEKSK
jgi:hypothetical protein